MVKIWKGEGEGKRELKVPLAAFENFFKGAGWQKSEGNNTTNTSEEDEWDDYVDGEESEEEFTKPLSEMNRYELEAYAAKLGVDLTGLNTNKQYREAIKAVM